MKVYLVTPEHYGYDGLVVTAENEEEALAFVKENSECKTEFFREGQGHIFTQEVDLTKKQIILTSFNAG